MIYNKEPILILWDFVKELKSKIKIYKESMDEQKDNVPDSYILLRSQVSDSTKVYGDGKSCIRLANCNITLVTKGYAEDTTDKHNTNKNLIKNCLKNKDVDFREINLGYNDSNQSTEHTFSLEVEYIG